MGGLGRSIAFPSHDTIHYSFSSFDNVILFSCQNIPCICILLVFVCPFSVTIQCFIDLPSLYFLNLSMNSLTSFVAISFTFSLGISYFVLSFFILSSVNVPVRNIAFGVSFSCSAILTFHSLAFFLLHS